jgi:hypothetical protein
MSRVRSTPRMTRKLVRKPSTMAIRPAATSAITGSLMMPCRANSPAEYAPTPKKAACPNETIPA